MKHCAALLFVICTVGKLHAQTPDRAAVASTVATGDTFSFRDGGSRVLSVALVGSGGAVEMSWPLADADNWDTAILGVEIVASADLPAPYVEITSGAASDRQYFRAGDAGPRWLNLSVLRGQVRGGSRVSLRGEGVSIAPGSTPLRLFVNRLELSRPLLVVAPHPDDAEIAAFGLYAGRNATVVTVTTGNAGPRSYEAVFDQPPDLYAFKGRIRLIDSITVPWLGGIPPERTFNMGYFDARLAEMHDNPGRAIPEMYCRHRASTSWSSAGIGLECLSERTRTAARRISGAGPARTNSSSSTTDAAGRR